MNHQIPPIEELTERIGELQLRNENKQFVQAADISQLLSKLTIEPSRKRKAPSPRSPLPKIPSDALADLTEAFSERLKIVNASHEEDDLSKMLSKMVLKHQVPQKIEDDLSKYLTKLTLQSQKHQKRQKRQSASPPPPLPLQPQSQAPNPQTLQPQRANKMILRKHSPIPHVIDVHKLEGLSARSGHLMDFLVKLLDIYRRLKQQKDYKGSISSLVENTNAIATAVPKKAVFKRLIRENETIDKAWVYIREMDEVASHIKESVDELKTFIQNDIFGIYPQFTQQITASEEAYVQANNLIINNKRVFRRIFEELLPLVPKINSIRSASAAMQS